MYKANAIHKHNLTGLAVVAAAFVAEASLSKAAKAAKRNLFADVATLAITAQNNVLENAGLVIGKTVHAVPAEDAKEFQAAVAVAFEACLVDLRALIRSDANQTFIKQHSLQSHEKSHNPQGEKLDTVGSLIESASKSLKNYAARFQNAWELGELVRWEQGAKGEILPETSGDLADRVKSAKALLLPTTPMQVVKSATDIVALNAKGTMEDCSREDADLYASLMTAANILVSSWREHYISNDRVKAIIAELKDECDTAAETARLAALLEIAEGDDGLPSTDPRGELVEARAA